jgi:4-carboxymuconolactone decarboxylase
MTTPTRQDQSGLGFKLAGNQFLQAKAKFARVDQGLADMLDEYVFDEVFANSSLSDSDRQLCIIASLIVQSHFNQSDFHLNVAAKVDVPLTKIIGLIVHCIPFSGWPKGASAVTALIEWAERNDVALPASSIEATYGSSNPDFTQLGRLKGREIYADYPGLEQVVEQMNPGLSKLVTEGIFGRVYGRKDLDIRERQLTAVAILTSLQRLPQLESHIKGAFMVGCKDSEIAEVIKLMHLYAGWPATLNAFSVLVNNR